MTRRGWTLDGAVESVPFEQFVPMLRFLKLSTERDTSGE
jgi:hypothetical protein